VITIVLTRLITSKISHERPLSAVAAMWIRELTAPRETTAGQGGAVTATRVRVNNTRPRKKQRQSRKARTKRERGGGVRTQARA
jgi:hypothetical protein